MYIVVRDSDSIKFLALLAVRQVFTKFGKQRG